MLPGKQYTVADVFPILRRRVWLIAVPPAVGLFCALIVSALVPNRYQSDMLIAIIPQRVPDSFVRTTVTLRTEERLDALATQVKSRTLLEQLIQEVGLYPIERQRLPMEDVVNLMRNDIGVVPEAPRRGPYGPQPLHAFHVQFTYTDPNVAAQITQRLGSLFVDQNVRDRGALAEATNQFLEAQLSESRRRLEATERKLEAFRQRHGPELPTQMASNLQVTQATQMQIQQLVEAQARDRDRKLMLERLYNEAQSEPAVMPVVPPPQPTTPAQSDLATGSAGTPEQRLAAARATLERLELRLRPEHPDVVQTRRLIRDLEAQMQAATGAENGASSGSAAAPQQVAPAATAEEQLRRERLRAMRAEIESLDRQMQFKESEEQRLRGVVTEYQRRIEAVPSVESGWFALTRDYDTQQTAYKELLKKSEESKVAADLERRQIGEQFRILDPAGVPTRPISPLRIRINGIGLAVGLILGLGIAALLELRDASFRTERDVREALALPVLALLPRVDTTAERARRFRKKLAFGVGGTIVAASAGYVAWAMRLWTYLV